MDQFRCYKKIMGLFFIWANFFVCLGFDLLEAAKGCVVKIMGFRPRPDGNFSGA